MSEPIGSSSQPSSNRTVMLVLSYLGILALVPLLIEKDDKEVQWHAKHGLVLLVAWVAFGFALTLLGHIPGVGCILLPIHMLLWISYLVVIVLCIVKAVNGGRFTLPGVSQFADRF